MNTNFQGRLAVVTGASSGIGLAVCDLLLQRGVRISEHRDRPFRLIVTAHFANA